MDMKAVKIAFIEAAFPELASPKMYQSGKGEGGTMKVAIRNAISNLLKSRVLARKHISVIKATITITEKANNEVQRITEEVCITCGQPKDAPEHKSKHQFEAKKEPNEAQV